MKTTRIETLAVLGVTAAFLGACGLKSASNNFGLDGVGNPAPSVGEIVTGKFGGSFEATRWVTEDPRLSPLIGPDGSLVQGLISSNNVEGLGALPLLVINTPPPARTPNTCYTNLGVFPELGGNLTFVDVGEEIDFKMTPPGGAAVTQAMPRSPADDALSSPITDEIFYFSDFNALRDIPYGSNDVMNWPGGTLAPKGYHVAAQRSGNDVVLQFPRELLGPSGAPDPLVNGTSMFSGASTGGIPKAADYHIQWIPNTLDSQGLGVEIIVQIYGPANLTQTTTDVEDLPYFNVLGQLVCVADEQKGSAGFTLHQSDLDALFEQIKGTTHYQNSTEDLNGNGVLDPGEDGNHNGQIDKVYGAVLILNRRAENTFQACTQPSGCPGGNTAPIFISGNASKYTHLAWIPQ